MANLNHHPDTRKSQKSEKRLQIKESTYDDTNFAQLNSPRIKTCVVQNIKQKYKI